MGNLPDPTQLGYNVLSDEDWLQKFSGSLWRYYHHISEKHCGEFVQIILESLGDSCDHPMLPEVHSSRLYGDTEDNCEIIQWATAFFKDKWWRDDNKRANWERYKFIRGMRTHSNSVWRPFVEADHWTSASYNITQLGQPCLDV